MLPVFRDKWLAIGLSCAPLDFDRAKAAACDAYRMVGLRPPALWLRFASPLTAAIGAALLQTQVRDQVWDQVWAQVWAQVGDQVRAQVGDQVGDQAGDQVWDQVYGNHDAPWLAFYDVFRDMGIAETDKLRPLMRLAETCGWWAPYKNVCILQDRPEWIRFDDRNLAHCANDMAIRYRDGFGVYCWHGVRIPVGWLDGKTLTPRIALTHSNLEQRRAACEILGWTRILKELNVKTIQRHTNPEIGELLEVELPEIGREKFLRVRCGTGREFALPVPPEMTTALEANAWTYGVAANDYQPEIRT